ncbi:MAG: magnesium/cobalt transporter CorA [Bacteroidota bacterium]
MEATIQQTLGKAPGTLVYTGSYTSIPLTIECMRYRKEELARNPVPPSTIPTLVPNKGWVNWYNVTGLHNLEVIEQLGKQFHIENLILEDVLNVSELPKMEDFEERLYVTLKMLRFDTTTGKTDTEHLSLVLGTDFLISFQEKEGDVFEPLRQRILKSSGKIRSRGNDYLLFALLESVTDNYMVVINEFGNRIEELEERIYRENSQKLVAEINNLKKELTQLRKYILPLDIAVRDLIESETELISDDIAHFFEDLKSHVSYVSQVMAEHRELLSGLMDLHLSLVSNEMNAIMKVLTIVAAIFIPLTFLAGIYGMNFEYMPELGWKWGYPTLLGTMLVLAIGLWVWMQKRKWL